MRFSTEALNRNTVPFAAVRRDREGEFVFRVDAQGRARRVAVRTGRRLAERVEMLDGLFEVHSGPDAGTSVRVRIPQQLEGSS